MPTESKLYLQISVWGRNTDVLAINPHWNIPAFKLLLQQLVPRLPNVLYLLR